MRIAACRLSQLTASLVYVLLVVLATPLMGLGTASGADDQLLELVQRVAPLLALPLVLCAVLSQFSAATGDTEAGVGNLDAIAWRPLRGPRRYLLVGVAGAALAATVSTTIIIVVASRACDVLRTAVRRCDAHKRLVVAARGYGVLAAVMLAIAVLAEPAG